MKAGGGMPLGRFDGGEYAPNDGMKGYPSGPPIVPMARTTEEKDTGFMGGVDGHAARLIP